MTLAYQLFRALFVDAHAGLRADQCSHPSAGIHEEYSSISWSKLGHNPGPAESDLVEDPG